MARLLAPMIAFAFIFGFAFENASALPVIGLECGEPAGTPGVFLELGTSRGGTQFDGATGCPGPLSTFYTSADGEASQLLSFSSDTVFHQHVIDANGISSPNWWFSSYGQALFTLPVSLGTTALVRVEPTISIDGPNPWDARYYISEMAPSPVAFPFYSGTGVAWSELFVDHPPIEEIVLELNTGVTHRFGSHFVTYANQTNVDQISTFSFTLTIVPEPSTALLLGLGLVGLAVRKRSLNPSSREVA